MSNNGSEVTATVADPAVLYAQKALMVALHDGWEIFIKADDVKVAKMEEHYALSYDGNDYKVVATFEGGSGGGVLRISSLRGPKGPLQAFTIDRFAGSTQEGEPVLRG